MNRNMEAITWALSARGLSVTAWKVLVMLARRVGKRGFDVWPKHKRLADDCEMSVSSVRRALKDLEDAGFVQIVARFDDEGDRTSNIYRLQVKAKLSFPDGDVDINPDEDDDEPSIPVRSGGGLFNLNTPPCSPVNRRSVQSDQTGLFTGEQAELIQVGTNSIEDSPPAPEGEQAGEADEPESLVAFFERRWAEIVAANDGRIAACRKVDDALKRQIELRGKEHLREGETPIDVWREVFDNIASSRFLRGLVPPGPGRDTAFKLSVSFVVRKTTFREILHGAFNRDRDPSLVDSSGRRLGPTDQALGATLQRLRASRAGGAGGGRQARLA